MMDLVVMGSLNMDLVVKADRAPEGGETLPGKEFHMIAGGKGANQAAAASRLGGKTGLVGRVGKDGFGTQLKANLAAMGVDTTRVIDDEEAPTGIALIIVDERGENRILIVAGSNGRVSPADINDAADRIRQAKLLIMQFEVPLETVSYALDLASQYLVPVLLNPAPAYKVGRDVLSKVTYLVLNESEAHLLTGLGVSDPSSAFQAAQNLRLQGARIVILTLGAQGAVVVSDKILQHIPAYKVKVVDTTAAGDAFIGGLAVSLVESADLIQAVRFGCAAGALAATRLGAQTSLPARAEVEALLKRGGREE
jgi:ribokinase